LKADVRAWAAMAVLVYSNACTHENDSVRQALIEHLETGTPAASLVCGYTVSSLGGVSVSNLVAHGTDSEGDASATVTGNPVGYTDHTPTGPCTGNVTFHYATAVARRRTAISTNGQRRQSTDMVTRITNLAMVGRPAPR
jgi:hypothetical protein